MKYNHLQSPEETNTAATMTACKARFMLFHYVYQGTEIIWQKAGNQVCES